MIKNILIGVLILLSAGILINSCSKEKKHKELVLSLEDQVAQVKDSLGKIIYLKDAEVVDTQESMKELRAKLFETTEKYNKKVLEVKALIAQKTKVRIDSVDVPYIDTAKMKQWSDSVLSNCRDVIQYYEDSTILIGTCAVDSTQYYIVDATVQKAGIRINRIELIDSQYISITKFKGGLLKKNTEGKRKLFLKKQLKIEVKHTNPYFKNIGINGFVYEEPNKHLFIKGLGTGIGLTLLGLILIK